MPVADKLLLLGINDTDIFPWQNELCDDILFHAFVLSYSTQPDMFLRIRPGQEGGVLRKLTEAGITHTVIAPSCIALPNTTKADSLLQLNKEAVIQDLSSQRVAQLLQLLPAGNKQWKVWDCCAASGGKSILVKDILGNIDLTVSDIRPSITANLKKRFEEAGISRYKSFTADLTDVAQLPSGKFDLIIADVPCSGSGTWGRTPEQLYHYDFTQTNTYAQLQQKIMSNVITRLTPGGYLLYITCSVFKKENEEMIAILQERKLQTVQVTLLKGYEEKADTMFAALLQMPL